MLRYGTVRRVRKRRTYKIIIIGQWVGVGDGDGDGDTDTEYDLATDTMTR